MKKIFTLLCAAALMCGTAQAQQVTSTTVTNKTEFLSALASAATLPAGSTAYIYVKGYVDAGTLKSGDGNPMLSTMRNLHFVGINDEETGERATLKFEMQIPAGNTEGDHFGLHFDNLKVSQSQGCWGNSKHLMNFKDANKHYVDSVVFRNCELTDLCRSFYRGEVNGAGEDYDGAGMLGYFEITNCEIHNAARQANAMPFIYLAQPVDKIIINNNTFYDMTYLNGLVSFGNVSENAGRKNIYLEFVNNTLCAWSKATLISLAGGVNEAEVHIKNNFLLQPNWADDMNGRYGDSNTVHGEMTTAEENPEAANGLLSQAEIDERIEKGVQLTNIGENGLVQLENNVLYGYKYQNGDLLIPIGDTEEEEVDFSSFTMEDVQFGWGDFVDAKNDMFQINEKHYVYTAGKNGAPIGNPSNYTNKVIEKVNVSVKIAGSETVSYTIEPVQEQYFTGNKITITLIDHNNALRTLNTFKGWSDGSMETVRNIELTGDLDLTATYEAAASGVVAWFDFSQIPAAGQNKLASYAADVLGNEANPVVATLTYWADATTDEEGNVTSEAGYKVADGSENRFNWRTGKFGEDPADQQISVISRKSSANAIANNTPDFFVFTLSTKDLKGVEFSAFCGTDNFGYKTQLADWSLDGENWTNFAKVDLEDRDAEYSIGAGKLWGWSELKGTLPAEAEGQEVVYIRVIGDATGDKVDNVVSGIDQTTANMFEYTGAVLITAGGGQQSSDQLNLIDRFTYCWNDAETQTHNADGSITYSSAQWGGIACWLGGEDWSAWDQIVFEFAEATPCAVQPFMQYADGTETKNYTDAGVTKVVTNLDAGKVSVNQAALQASEAATFNITKIYLTKGGQDGIQTVQALPMQNGVRYSLSGQQVDGSYKGIVIMNGKKYMVK